MKNHKKHFRFPKNVEIKKYEVKYKKFSELDPKIQEDLIKKMLALGLVEIINKPYNAIVSLVNLPHLGIKMGEIIWEDPIDYSVAN